MKNRFLVKLFSVALLSVSLISCKKEDDENSNQITDSAGVKIALNWSLNDGSSATAGADLDLFLYKGTDMTNEIDFSDMTTSFEEVQLTAGQPDGDFTIAVDHFDIDAGQVGKFNVKVTGLTSGSTDTYDINDFAFAASDEGEKNAVVRIKKQGNTYTITKL